MNAIIAASLAQALRHWRLGEYSPQTEYKFVHDLLVSGAFDGAEAVYAFLESAYPEEWKSRTCICDDLGECPPCATARFVASEESIANRRDANRFAREEERCR